MAKFKSKQILILILFIIILFVVFVVWSGTKNSLNSLTPKNIILKYEPVTLDENLNKSNTFKLTFKRIDNTNTDDETYDGTGDNLRVLNNLNAVNIYDGENGEGKGELLVYLELINKSTRVAVNVSTNSNDLSIATGCDFCYQSFEKNKNEGILLTFDYSEYSENQIVEIYYWLPKACNATLFNAKD